MDIRKGQIYYAAVQMEDKYLVKQWWEQFLTMLYKVCDAMKDFFAQWKFASVDSCIELNCFVLFMEMI